MKKEQILKIQKALAKKNEKRHLSYCCDCSDHEPKNYLKQAFSVQYRPRKNMFNGRNVSFNPETKTAYSYNWWIFVREIKGKIIFNDFRYSNCTSKHQYQVKGLLQELGIKIDLMIDVPAGLQQFETGALRTLYQKLFTKEMEMNRPRSSKEVNKQRKKDIQKLKADIVAARKLGAKISKEDVKFIKETINNNELSRLEQMRLKAEQNREINRATKELETSQVVFNVESLVS